MAPQPKTADADRLLSVSGASRIVGVSERRIRELADDGSIPSFRDLTTRRLFKQSDVVAFAAKRAQKK